MSFLTIEDVTYSYQGKSSCSSRNKLGNQKRGISLFTRKKRLWKNDFIKACGRFASV